MKEDITDKVDFDPCDIDSECLPLLKCVCGKEFDHWEFVLSIYEDNPYECPECGRKMFFRVSIRIYEVK